MRRPVIVALFTATGAALAGCGANAALTAATLAPDYSCEDITVPGHTLTDGRLASELSPAGRRTVLQTEGVTRANLQTWRIVEDSTARVTIIRPLDQPEKVGDQVVASHQYVDRTPWRSSDPARPKWMVSIPLTCTLQELTGADADVAPPAARAPAKKAPAKGAGKATTKSKAKPAPARPAPAAKSPAADEPAKAPAAETPTVRATGKAPQQLQRRA